jgi:hypothetical protein
MAGGGGPTLIFLDVDGVLHGASPTAEQKRPWVENKSGLFNKGGRLKKLIDTTGAMIVLSSSWRRDPPMLAMLQEEFAGNGWDLTIDDVTPVIPGAQREQEIATWFMNEDIDPSEVTWIAIDDDDLAELPEENFVHCADPEAGLTVSLLKEAVAKLR